MDAGKKVVPVLRISSVSQCDNEGSSVHTQRPLSAPNPKKSFSKGTKNKLQNVHEKDES